MATSGRGLDLIVGVAGSGKTTVLTAVRVGFQACGFQVLGAALRPSRPPSRRRLVSMLAPSPPCGGG